MSYEKIRVVVETEERTFRGYVHKPIKDDSFRLSDYINTYEKGFLCLTEVTINDRGQQHRVGEKRDFVAVGIHAITYIAPEQE